MPQVMAAAELDVVLHQLLQHDSSQIKQAEATMRKALTKPLFICDLFEMIQLSPSAEIRQLAAVLVRRRIGARQTHLHRRPKADTPLCPGGQLFVCWT